MKVTKQETFDITGLTFSSLSYLGLVLREFNRRDRDDKIKVLGESGFKAISDLEDIIREAIK